MQVNKTLKLPMVDFDLAIVPYRFPNFQLVIINHKSQIENSQLTFWPYTSKLTALIPAFAGTGLTNRPEFSLGLAIVGKKHKTQR
ncbi:unnamed protein product [marine sediment metagenome]|uniref:Uncharacterized protein n=1 Tax=marine sediment metagenome TaxID=412755 RepID=X1DHP6_9ZZZZ